MENEGRLAKLALRNADGAGDLRSQAQSQNHMTLGDISLLIPVGERIDDLATTNQEIMAQHANCRSTPIPDSPVVFP